MTSHPRPGPPETIMRDSALETTRCQRSHSPSHSGSRLSRRRGSSSSSSSSSSSGSKSSRKEAQVSSRDSECPLHRKRCQYRIKSPHTYISHFICILITLHSTIWRESTVYFAWHFNDPCNQKTTESSLLMGRGTSCALSLYTICAVRFV